MDHRASGHRSQVHNPDRESLIASLPRTLVVDQNGNYWRVFEDGYSMCPVSTDNDPLVPVATYVLLGSDEALLRDKAILARLQRHEEELKRLENRISAVAKTADSAESTARMFRPIG